MNLVKSIWFLSCVLCFQSLIGQEPVINQVDNLGRKQGVWQKTYPNGRLMYIGTFKDGKPVDTLKRYHDNGMMKAIMVFEEGSDHSRITVFYDNGEKSAEGFHKGNKKDSVWKFYSFYTGDLVSSETYVQGVKHGKERVYYANGQISDEFIWENNIKHGMWKQFFEDGTKKLEARYQHNQLTGGYVVFHTNGVWMAKGKFIEDQRHGKWMFYDEKGKVKYEINYEFGVPDNQEEKMRRDQEFFKKVEENMGKFEEPSVEDFFRGGGY
ncbi:MAG: toxin-antitoxin system YwqK family antitoxin [Bacteroidales bacterium]|nr:toxin-antitoxin system YwqK family antitoxin [Bacteroidales bacterium]